MARPRKSTAEYFSHDANASDGRTLTIIQNHFGLEGYAVWFKLLERVSSTENHVIDTRNPENLEYLAAKIGLAPEKLVTILNKLADLDAIDRPLWQARIIWCQKLVDRLVPVYKLRKQDLPSKPEFPVPETALLVTETLFHQPETPQSKLKETKLKETTEPPIVPQKGDIYLSGKNGSLPDWLNRETWDSFLEMRKKQKASPTPRAAELLIAKLDRFRLAGDDPNEVLNQSTMNSWKGVFALKEASRGTSQSSPRSLPKQYHHPRTGELLEPGTDYEP